MPRRGRSSASSPRCAHPLGSPLQGAVRGTRAGAALSLPLHASCRHLEPPPRCRRQHQHRVPLQGLSHQRPRPLEDDAASPARVYQALPDARPSHLGIRPPLGASGLPRATRYQQILIVLREKICSKSAEILARLKSEEISLATVIADLLLSTFTGLPIPAHTVARSIATIGIERFCVNPAGILV